MKALVYDGKVIQVVEDVDEFPVYSDLQWMTAPVGCEVGWVDNAGTLEAPAASTPSDQEEMDRYSSALKDKLTTKAQEKDYDNETSIMTYQTSGNATWKAEADQFQLWRDDVWAYAIGVYTTWLADPNTKPTLDDFLANCPDLTWS